MYELQLKKSHAIVTQFESSGQQWVEEYPSLMADCVSRWGLTLLGTASAGLPINVIHYAKTREGQPVVLKVGFPHPEQKTELLTLRCYGGRYAVRVVDWDEKSGALLMERICPGKNLREHDFRAKRNELTRSQIGSELIDKLPRPAKAIEGLPTWDAWLSRAFDQCRDEKNDNDEFLCLIDLAESLYLEIKMMHPETFLLHGDLHHENMLHDEVAGWIAIDPKGVIGPKIMECGRFIQNFIEDEIANAGALIDVSNKEIMSVLDERLETFHHVTGYDRVHLAMVTFVDQMLSNCWCVNAGQVVSLRKARLIKDFLVASD